ncbi:MAG TPA: hypothetical protein VMY35_14440 [Phycisphaerae bacterium]|nr:hypothetical protein [Phycisphaerae bacterium]
MTDPNPITSADLLRMLHTRYSDTGWAFFAEVPDRTAGHFRRADAVAISLWPSRGLHLHGFEVKVSRRDWLDELKRPEKAESIGKYCDFWWLVVSDSSIVEDGELPSAWGLLAPSGNGLRTLVKPTALEPLPIGRPFLCSLLRKFAEGQVPRVSIQNKLAAEYKRGEEAAARMASYDAEDALKLRDAVKVFEGATGLKIRWSDLNELAQVKRFVGLTQELREGAANEALALAARTVKRLRDVATALEGALQAKGSGDV